MNNKWIEAMRLRFRMLAVQKQERQERHRFHIFAEERAQVVFQIEQARACHTRTGQIMMKFVQNTFEALVGPRQNAVMRDNQNSFHSSSQ